MSSRANILKGIVKGTKIEEGAEEGLLHRYLMSRGIDPRYVTKDVRISHSKSGQFLKWKSQHNQDNVRDPMSEEVDKKDTVTLDIPLIIRVLELAREDLKSDMDLHRVVEKLIEIRNKGTLTMDDYEFIANIKEDYAHIIESKEGNYGGDYQSSVLAVKAKAEKKPVDMKSLAARMQASYAKDKKEVKEGAPIVVMPAPIDVRNPKKEFKKLDLDKIGTPAKPPSTEKRGVKGRPGQRPMPTYEETVSEGNGYDDNRTGFAKKPREDDEGYGKPKFKAKSTMDRPHTVHIDGKPWKKFSNGHQANAAVNTLTAKGKKATAIAHFKENALDGATEQTSTGDGYTNMNPTLVKQQLSKSARMIKAIYKHHKVVKEDTYDHEKDDKSIATYGKKPKVTEMDKDVDAEKQKIKAAAVLSGGSTLTGEPRDTVEIDPIMRVRPGQPDPAKNVKK